jgi:hypothetical protein
MIEPDISPAKLGALPAQLSLILDRIDARLAPGATCWMQVPAPHRSSH